MTLWDAARPYWDGACKQLAQQLDREIMTTDNPLNVVVTESALPTVDTMPPAAVTVTCGNCHGSGVSNYVIHGPAPDGWEPIRCDVCDGFGRVPGPPEMVMSESTLPYVALVLYAAQQVEGEQPEFARQLVEAARYFEGLIEQNRVLHSKLFSVPTMRR